MPLLVEVIDSQCSLRRRQLAVRAERHLLLQPLPRTSWNVRDFAGITAWREAHARLDNTHMYVAFLHASESEPSWDSLVLQLAHMHPAPPHTLLVTYTGGNAQPEAYWARDDIGNKYVAGITAWWRHYGEVRSIRDYSSSPWQAVDVGLDSDKLPLEDCLSDVLATSLGGTPSAVTSRQPPSSHGVLETTLLGPDQQTGLRHVLVNAVGPLREAIDFAQATGSHIAALPELWVHCKESLAAHTSSLPPWMIEALQTCEAMLLPHNIPGPDVLSALSRILGQIQAVALACDAAGNPWGSVASVLSRSSLEQPVRVLWIDDDAAWFSALQPAFAQFALHVTHTTAPDWETIVDDSHDRFDAAVLDLRLDGQASTVTALLQRRGLQLTEPLLDATAGLGILQLFQSLPFRPPVFILSATETPAIIKACVQYGAKDYFVKGRGDYIRLLTELRREGEDARSRKEVTVRPANARVVVSGSRDPLARILFWLERIASSSSRGPVLFVGEPGVGKEELARELHLRSRRRDRPFVVVDCSTIAPGLIESELFGHTKGAFTGANAQKTGLLETASGGVVFLDEVDKLDSQLQTRLLRVLEAGTIRRVGDTAERTVDILVVLASNIDPASPEGNQFFSAALVTRLQKFTFRIPPLRERSDAVPDIALALCTRLAAGFGWLPPRLSDDALEWLKRQSAAGRFDNTSGNIRGVRNLLERALVCFREATELGQAELQTAFDAADYVPPSDTANIALDRAVSVMSEAILREGACVLQRLRDDFEAHLLREMITRGGRESVAHVFGWTSDNLRQYVHKLRKKGVWPWDI